MKQYYANERPSELNTAASSSVRENMLQRSVALGTQGNASRSQLPSNLEDYTVRKKSGGLYEDRRSRKSKKK